MYSRRRAPGYGLLLLAYQVFGVIGIQYIPPVTLALVGLQAAIYLRVFQFLPWRRASEVCVSLYNVWHRREYKRLLFAAFEHANDWHLYYNMLSFVMKGQSLERRFGSAKFLYLIAVFSVLTNSVLVGLNYLANEYYEYGYESRCAIGFSGVLFALKVLTTHYFPSYTQHIMGFPVFLQSKYALWLELVLIQVLVPNVSFLGHLAGILVGLAYIKSPLGTFLDTVYSAFTGPVHPARPQFQPRAESTGYAHAPPRMFEEEQIRRATEASLRDNTSPFFSPYSLNPDLDELRRRRAERY